MLSYQLLVQNTNYPTVDSHILYLEGLVLIKHLPPSAMEFYLHTFAQNLSYSKMIISDFRLQDKENTEYISIYSNIWGRLIGAAVYDEHMAIKEYVSLEMLGAQDFLTKERDTSKSIYQKNKTVFPIYRRSKVIPSNILKYDDSRPSNNHGVNKQRGSLNLIIY